jgi:predicted MFS family arabinose efflux permease
MTAWVIAETGALVAAPTAALTLGVAGVRACLGAINRARGRQHRSPITRPPQRIGQPVLLLAAPVAELAPPTAELIPATAELVPATAELVPATAELVPATAELVPATAELVPATAELVPAIPMTVPQARPGRPPTPRTPTWGGLPKVFWRLVITLVPGRGLACVYLTLAYYAARGRHLDASQVAVVLAAFGVGWAAGPPIAGWAADRIGPRKVIIAGNVAAWAAYTVAGMARSAVALAAGAAAVGLVFEMWRPAAQSMLASAAEDEIQRKRCMSLLTWIINVLLTVATLAGGALAAYAGWGWLFVASATGAAAFAALAWLLLPRDRPRRPARAPQRGGLASDPLLWAFTALTLLILTAGQQSVYALPVRFAGTGIGPLGYGVIAAMNPLTVAVLQPFAQRWLVRLPAVPLCAAGMALIGIGIAVTGAGTGLAWYAGTSAIWTLGEIAAAGLAPAIVASIAPPGRAGAYLGIWGSALGLSTLTAAVAGDAVIGAGGLSLLWACCAATGVVAGVACACLGRPVAARRNGQIRGLGAGQAGPAPSTGDSLATG